MADSRREDRHAVTRRLRRAAGLILLGGLLASALAYAGGHALIAWQIRDDAAVLQSLEATTRRQFSRGADQLQRLAAGLAAAPAVSRGLQPPAPQLLFDTIDRAGLPVEADGTAVTVYDATGRPVAWRGRPSEIPPERTQAGAAVFVAYGALGLRLVAVEPVTADGRRVGTIAAEQRLSSADPGAASDAFVLQTALGPVTLQRTFADRPLADAPGRFVLTAPSGEALLQAAVPLAAPARAREVWGRRVRAIALTLGAATLLLAASTLALVRSSIRSPASRPVSLTIGVLVLLASARALLWFATPPAAWSTETVRSWFVYASALLPAIHRSPIDLLFTALALSAAVLSLADPLRVFVLRRRGRRRPFPGGPADAGLALAIHALAGVVVLALEIAVLLVVRDTAQNSEADLLRLTLFPWETPRLALLVALVLLQGAALWGGVIVCRMALAGWRWDGRAPVRLLLPAALALPAVAAALVSWGGLAPASAAWPPLPIGLAGITSAWLAWLTRRGVPWTRRGTQAGRLGWLLMGLLVPAWFLYPGLVHFVEGAKRQLIEQQFAVQVRSHPSDLQAALKQALDEIDAVPELPALVAAVNRGPSGPPTGPAFELWRRTDLAEERLTSAVELYASDGTLVSRFALNFPEAEAVPLRYESEGGGAAATQCTWEVFGEVQPFGADERRMLHAERGVCTADASGRTQVVGAIVVHVMLDYSALGFISSQSPYFEFIRAPRGARREGTAGGDVDLTIFGWGRLPIYTSSSQSWRLTDEAFERAYRSRAPFWTTLERGDQIDQVHVSNDRNGIYVVGYPVLTPFNHLVHLGELTTLTVLLFIGLMFVASLVRRLLRRGPYPAELLVREIRASFYRKLFLAFVAATVVPVLALALLVRAYVASQLRDDVEAEAARTALTARRVIEESLALQQRGTTTVTSPLSDDVMVWISRVIDQDVNIFDDSQLLVTSERDLFASGLLPTRTPAAVYRAVAIERLPTYVGQDRIGDFTYLVAAAPVRIGNRDATLTVPLATRQREIEREIDDLDRGVLLGALVLILLGAGLGYWMAERIGDPVQRLTRATRRIAAGDLSTRVIVRTADELQRLVEAFNRMAGELQRQRAQLERTHRLEAWAEMARQVAHDIKNPLTPIQLSAEHLRRVHQDRGQPLAPVLESCVESILAQVRLLRQIAAEFSSFGSSPTARPAPTAVGELLHEVIDPYVAGTGDRVRFEVLVEAGLPPVPMDRLLLGRAITNIIENSLHAMPGGGTFRVEAARADGALLVTLSDTGVGMDADAAARIFEPYFSTKTAGTGLGLSIARRNVELHGGTIEVASRKGAGTTVRIRLPLDGTPGANADGVNPG